MSSGKLATSCATKVRRTCREYNPLLCYLPKESTDSSQMKDALHCRQEKSSADRCLGK